MHIKIPLLSSFLLVGLVALLSCKRSNSFIPQVPVNVTINTLDPSFQNLNGIGSWAYVNGGSKGIIVFHAEFNEFKAFDRHCTYTPESSCSKVDIDDTQLYAVDSCCNSKFQLIDGLPVEGPARIGLQQYNTSYDGNIIQIWN